MNPDITVRPIDPKQTHALRQAVLRPHQQVADMVFPGDALADTFHLGAADHTASLIGIVSFYKEGPPAGPHPGDWRLRGMAVAAEHQGRGVGQRLVEVGMEAVRAKGGQRIWCNARVSAMGFYAKLGFQTQGDIFEIPTIGPHYMMAIAVDSPGR